MPRQLLPPTKLAVNAVGFKQPTVFTFKKKKVNTEPFLKAWHQIIEIQNIYIERERERHIFNLHILIFLYFFVNDLTPPSNKKKKTYDDLTYKFKSWPLCFGVFLLCSKQIAPEVGSLPGSVLPETATS